MDKRSQNSQAMQVAGSSCAPYRSHLGWHVTVAKHAISKGCGSTIIMIVKYSRPKLVALPADVSLSQLAYHGLICPGASAI